MGALNAAAPTLFSTRLFCTHRNPLKPEKIQEFYHKLMEFEFLHPQLSISYATPVRLNKSDLVKDALQKVDLGVVYTIKFRKSLKKPSYINTIRGPFFCNHPVSENFQIY